MFCVVETYFQGKVLGEGSLSQDAVVHEVLINVATCSFKRVAAALFPWAVQDSVSPTASPAQCVISFFAQLIRREAVAHSNLHFSGDE